jgi:hypothetical protein
MCSIKIWKFLCSSIMMCSIIEKYEMVIFNTFGMSKN